MSSLYASEPITKGKVILHTSFGDIDIELWGKECPLAVRNFVQLSLEGYYDNTIFHRVIKDFMIQGGDPTGTGTGGESIYGHPFKDEFHSRIKFNHRGIVAMANSGENDNGSQFFITLAETPWLDNKHTIFGKVTGNTIFNVLKAGEVETDSNDKPIQKLVIKNIEVLVLPFDDIFPRNVTHKTEEEKKDDNIDKKPKIKKIKNLNLLSFGDEAEEDEEIIKTSNCIIIFIIVVGIKSAHDVLKDDPILKNEVKVKIDSKDNTAEIKAAEFKKKIKNLANKDSDIDLLENMKKKQKEIEVFNYIYIGKIKTK